MDMIVLYREIGFNHHFKKSAVCQVIMRRLPVGSIGLDSSSEQRMRDGGESKEIHPVSNSIHLTTLAEQSKSDWF
jgi:hypothetical protein